METRSARNVLLAAAASVGVVAGLVLIATEALGLSDLLGFPFHPAYRVVAAVMRLLGAVAFTAAFVASLVGFLQFVAASRARLLAIAAFLFGVYGAARFGSQLLEFLVESWSVEPWKFLAAQAAAAADGFAVLVAALLVAVAFLSNRPGRRLGWACLALAGHFALAATGFAFELAGFYDLGPFTPGARLVGALVTVATGNLLAAIAALVGATAFSPGRSTRNRRLGVAAIVFVAGFLATMAGFIVFATGGASASICLEATFPFLLAVAAAVGAVAFFRGLEQGDGPDLAVLPDPA